MLSRVLPGLREFRTPLSAGLTLLFAAWVLSGDKLYGPGDPFESFNSRLLELRESLGVASIGAALAFVGYLLGAVTTKASPPTSLQQAVHSAGRSTSYELLLSHGERGSWLRRRSWWPNVARWLRSEDGRRGRGSLLDESVAEMLRRAELAGIPIDSLTSMAEFYPYTTGLAHEFKLEDGQNTYDYTEFNVGLVVESLADGVVDELPAMENRLLIEREPLFDRYDRLRSEAEFRIGMTIPVAALAVALSVRVNFWCSALFFGAAVLFVQGVRRFYAGRAIIWQALSQELVTSDLLVVLENAVVKAEAEQTGGRAA